MSIRTDIATELPDAELVFAFVAPLGTPLKAVEEALHQALSAHGYSPGVSVRISKLLDEMVETPPEERPHQRQERLMDAGNNLREKRGNDHLALLAISTVKAAREEAEEGAPLRRQAHVIRSLKHPDEVRRLRHVYGKGFFLIGATAPRDVRLQALIEKNFPKDEAQRLLDKDASEEAASGQQTRDAFDLADAYVRLDPTKTEQAVKKIRRIVDLLFSYPFHPPTPEEHAMFMAYAAALKSSDLSRQVGAVVTSAKGDVLASGANDAPGGIQPRSCPSPELDTATTEAAGPDYLRGYDSNERERNRILSRVIRALVPGEEGEAELAPADRAKLIERYKEQLKGTGILDLTEFGRAVHAEMAALMACVRIGVSPRGGALYCPTFPCHNCAKHIVASGVREVFYVEPYPKSKARDLHGDEICLPDEEAPGDDDERVRFRAFEGVGPRRFLDLFSLTLGSGRPVMRKKKGADGQRVDWQPGQDSRPRLPLDPRSYIEREVAAAEIFGQSRQNHDKVGDQEGEHGREAAEAKDDEPEAGA